VTTPKTRATIRETRVDEAWITDLLAAARRAPDDYMGLLDNLVTVHQDTAAGRLRALAFWICSVLIDEEEQHGVGDIKR
jgi:hypothetical protein